MDLINLKNFYLNRIVGRSVMKSQAIVSLAVPFEQQEEYLHQE